MVSMMPHPTGAEPARRIGSRVDFPLLRDAPLGCELHYLDNAATSHKPEEVIDAIAACYRGHYGPVHRGLYPLAEEATARYEDARQQLAQFVGAESAEQVVFTRSATEAINLVAQGWARPRLQPGERVYVSRMEHHANFLPWQQVCRETGAELRVLELDDEGRLQWQEVPDLFAERTALIALSYVSNVLGVINPVAPIIAQARTAGIPVLLDATQASPHLPIRVDGLGCDFLAVSAHKMYGPSGIGLLYGNAERLREMRPLLLGGGMVDSVGPERSSWAPVPARFEAGSPNLADAIGFAAAARYLQSLGLEAVERHLRQLTHETLQGLSDIPGVEIYGPVDADQRCGIISFNLRDVHPHDVGQIAGEMGVALRAGHHCCQPLMHHLGVAATVRASFAVYNDGRDVAALCNALERARELLG